MSNTNDPNTPSSALSKKARLAHWITGGTDCGPSTMSSFVRMTRDRNDVKKATKAWTLAGARGLEEHQGQWGRLARPRGTALIRWYREGGGGGGGDGVGGRDGHGVNPVGAAGQPETQQEGRQGQEQTGPVEDDIYGSGDDTRGPRAEGGNTGDGDNCRESDWERGWASTGW